MTTWGFSGSHPTSDEPGELRYNDVSLPTDAGTGGIPSWTTLAGGVISADCGKPASARTERISDSQNGLFTPFSCGGKIRVCFLTQFTVVLFRKAIAVKRSGPTPGFISAGDR